MELYTPEKCDSCQKKLAPEEVFSWLEFHMDELEEAALCFRCQALEAKRNAAEIFLPDMAETGPFNGSAIWLVRKITSL